MPSNDCGQVLAAQYSYLYVLFKIMRISIVQFTPAFCEIAYNLQQIKGLLYGLQTDLVVLPELSTTGYSFLTRDEAFDAAAEAQEQTLDFFRQTALQLKAVIVAGFAECDGGAVYNSALIALPGGGIKIYRKTHLFFREKLCFSPGNSGFFVVEHPLLDCRIGVMVCNDWRYPEAARSLALLGADIIACPSNLVSQIWHIGMAARALENKVYLAVANRCGTEIRTLGEGETQSLTFTGSSVLYNYTGELLEQAGKDEDRILTLEIDPLQTRDKFFNVYNDLLNDRRPELYIG